MLPEPVAQGVGIIGLVGKRPASGPGGLQHRDGQGDVGDVAGVRARAIGLPAEIIARQWILQVLPLRERPIASYHSPFLSLLPNDAPYVTAIYRKLVGYWSRCCDLLEQSLPDAMPGPAIVTIGSSSVGRTQQVRHATDTRS